MKYRVFLMSFLIAMGFVLVGCGGGGSEFSATVKGKVVNLSGDPLKDITVFSGSRSDMTNAKGEYELSFAKEGKTTISAKGTGYAESSEVLTVVSGVNSMADIVLAKVGTVKQFDASDGSTVKDRGAEVVLPGGAYEKSDGSSYTGKVTSKVTYNRVTTPEGRESFPGTFVGFDPDTSQESGLQSYGFMTVELEATNGDPLQMKNSTAMIKFPPDPTMALPSNGDTIPLWYFDTEKSIWVKQGNATYSASTGFYEGTVSHFTTWNLDKKFDGATVNGCIEDAGGNRVTSADLYVSAPGWIKSFHNEDPAGEFKLINAPTGDSIYMRAVRGGWMSSEHNVTLTPGQIYDMSDANSSGCLVLDQNASASFVEIKGRVVDENGTAISGQSMSFTALDVHLWRSDTTDSNGSFSFTVMRSGFDKFQLSTYYDGIDFSSMYPFDPLAPVIDVGTITLATATVTGCVTLKSGYGPLNDGTVRGSDGRTLFGTYRRALMKDSPSGMGSGGHSHYPGSNVAFDDNGNFSTKFKIDNMPHKIYAHLYDANSSKYISTGMKDIGLVLGDSSLGSSADTCIQLHQIADINQSATVTINTSNADGTVGVYVSFSDGYNWGNITNFNDRNKTVSFYFDRDGLYTISQSADWDANVTFEGTMTLETGGVTHTITIPNNATANEMWTAFMVEVYDGSVDVKEVNMGW